MDRIGAMRTFAAVAAQHSFTSGARRLGISTKLASKQVRQLEEQLGAQLLNRTTRSVSLTETGRAYFERCVPLLDQFDELEGLVQERQSELAGPIRLTAPTGFGSLELVNAIRPFQLAHPKVSLDMHLSDQHVAIVEEGIDIAVRFGALKDSSLVARKLMDMRMVVVAAPDYLARHGRPSDAYGLATHNCLIQKTSATPQDWLFRIGGKQVLVHVDGSFHANSPRALTHMAIGGLGIARCPHYAVAPFIASGELELLFPELEVTTMALYAVYPPGRHLTARIRALIDHLAETFS